MDTPEEQHVVEVEATPPTQPTEPTPQGEVVPTPINEGVVNEGTTISTPEGVAVPTENVDDSTPAGENQVVTPVEQPTSASQNELEPIIENNEDNDLPESERRSYKWWEDGVKLERLRDAFHMGCDVGEACLYTEITRDQYEYYCRNIDKRYREKVKIWRENPTLIARTTVTRAIKDDADLAMKYLERRKKDEFGLRSEVVGTNGAPLSMVIDIVRQKQESSEEE